MAGKRGKGIVYSGFKLPDVPDNAPKEHIRAVIKLLLITKDSQLKSKQVYEQMKPRDEKAIRTTQNKIDAIDNAIKYYTDRLAEAKE